VIVLLLAAVLFVQAPVAQPPVAPAQDAQAPAETVREIRVHGNVTMADNDVVRLAGISVGAVLDAESVKTIEHRLRESGRFDEVRVRKQFRTLDMSEVALVLLVHEKPGVTPQGDPPSTMRRIRSRTMFFPILHYDEGYGWTYGARTAVVDLFGGKERISAPLSWGGTRRAAVEVERTFNSGPLTRVFGSYGISQNENPHFELDDRRVGVSGRAERRLFGRLTLGGEADRTDVTFGGIPDSIWRTGADVQLDTRNDPAYPLDSVLLRARWAGLHGISGAAGGQDGVNEYGFAAHGYKRLFGVTVLALRADYDTSSALPVYEQYLLGGSHLRGTPAGEFAGDQRLLLGAELRVPFTSPLNGSRTGFNVFMDGGAIAGHSQSIRHVPMERGVGAGLFLVAAVIRLNLEVAHSLDGRGTRVHFGTGFTF